jgi:hypothetical protein
MILIRFYLLFERNFYFQKENCVILEAVAAPVIQDFGWFSCHQAITKVPLDLTMAF